jgi:hypothetical protein
MLCLSPMKSELNTPYRMAPALLELEPGLFRVLLFGDRRWDADLEFRHVNFHSQLP